MTTIWERKKIPIPIHIQIPMPIHIQIQISSFVHHHRPTCPIHSVGSGLFTAGRSRVPLGGGIAGTGGHAVCCRSRSGGHSAVRAGLGSGCVHAGGYAGDGTCCSAGCSASQLATGNDVGMHGEATRTTAITTCTPNCVFACMLMHHTTRLHTQMSIHTCMLTGLGRLRRGPHMAAANDGAPRQRRPPGGVV